MDISPICARSNLLYSRTNLRKTLMFLFPPKFSNSNWKEASATFPFPFLSPWNIYRCTCTSVTLSSNQFLWFAISDPLPRSTIDAHITLLQLHVFCAIVCFTICYVQWSKYCTLYFSLVHWFSCFILYLIWSHYFDSTYCSHFAHFLNSLYSSNFVHCFFLFFSIMRYHISIVSLFWINEPLIP